MFISKNKFNFWQISQKASDKNNQPMKDAVGNDIYCSMNVYFKKGAEPTEEELNKYSSYEGDLQFVDKQGHIRKAYLLPNVYVSNQGVQVKSMKLYLDEWQFTKEDGTAEPIVHEPSKDDNPKQVVIDPDELPFY